MSAGSGRAGPPLRGLAARATVTVSIRVGGQGSVTVTSGPDGSESRLTGPAPPATVGVEMITGGNIQIRDGS